MFLNHYLLGTSRKLLHIPVCFGLAHLILAGIPVLQHTAVGFLTGILAGSCDKVISGLYPLPIMPGISFLSSDQFKLCVVLAFDIKPAPASETHTY